MTPELEEFPIQPRCQMTTTQDYNNNCKNKSKTTCDFMFKLKKVYPVYFIVIDNELESDQSCLETMST